MATYIVGDVQGCYDALSRLVDKIHYDPAKDNIWFAGDLVNRGPDSLKALRLVRQIADKVVLGNHDLHLLACHYGTSIQARSKDTLDDIFSAADRDELMSWLVEQPLLIWDKKRQVALSHAGVPHIWSVSKAQKMSREVEAILSSESRTAFFDAMYGNEPASWEESLAGLDRARVITNYLTRMRFIAEDGRLDFKAKESVDVAPEGYRPWFEYPRPKSDKGVRFFFGHWAALNGVTGKPDIIATDTGCVWGGSLTAVKLKTGERISCGGSSER